MKTLLSILAIAGTIALAPAAAENEAAIAACEKSYGGSPSAEPDRFAIAVIEAGTMKVAVATGLTSSELQVDLCVMAMAGDCGDAPVGPPAHPGEPYSAIYPLIHVTLDGTGKGVLAAEWAEGSVAQAPGGLTLTTDKLHPADSFYRCDAVRR